jgi:hypothetical protein
MATPHYNNFTEPPKALSFDVFGTVGKSVSAIYANSNNNTFFIYLVLDSAARDYVR